MDYPITVKAIEFESSDTIRTNLLFGGKTGDMVAVRPCAKEYEGKTFLGVLIGDVALTIGAEFRKETGTLTLVRGLYNPAILIPEKNAIVYGCGSWWSRIRSEDDLRQISDADIENVWYVKALKQLEENSAHDPA